MVIEIDGKTRLGFYRRLVESAVEQRKTFRMVCSGSTASGVRNKLKAELIKRGFVEHVEIKEDSVYHRMSINSMLDGARDGNDFETALLARLFDRHRHRHPVANFIWLTGPQMKYFAYPRATQLNRVRFLGTNFTQKHGLCEYVRKINKEIGVTRAGWPEAGDRVAHIPRMYELTDDADLQNFEKDYQWSTAVGLLTFLSAEDNVERWFNTRHFSLELDGIVLALRVIAHAVARVETKSVKVGEIDAESLLQVYIEMNILHSVVVVAARKTDHHINFLTQLVQKDYKSKFHFISLHLVLSSC